MEVLRVGCIAPGTRTVYINIYINILRLMGELGRKLLPRKNDSLRKSTEGRQRLLNSFGLKDHERRQADLALERRVGET